MNIDHPDQIFVDFHLITMDGEGYGLVSDGALATRDGTIQWIGKADELEPMLPNYRGNIVHGEGKFLSPGLVDCHTHVVWGGNRADEWQRRLTGVSYEEIAREGGGILSTVRQTREASEDELFEQAAKRARFLASGGVTTIEIKSGYGLDLATEQKMLRVAQQIGASCSELDVATTFLGAHAIPPEFAGRSDEYIDSVCSMIPEVVSLCEAVDVFCENIAFDIPQTRKVFETAIAHDLAIKIHAEQLSNLGGAKLAAEMSAWSADHLEYLDRSGAEAMADHGTVAVLLPGAFYFINETQKPPVDLLREFGVPIAVATDANPGSSPVASLLLMMNMACTLFALTPPEALAAVTRNAARALRREDKIGTLSVGKQADMVVWDIQTPAELAYAVGHNPCLATYKRGEKVVG